MSLKRKLAGAAVVGTVATGAAVVVAGVVAKRVIDGLMGRLREPGSTPVEI
ncbi:MAG: hypothetical protein ACYC1U_10090 [Candidatus Aquicultorales bacterium]